MPPIDTPRASLVELGRVLRLYGIPLDFCQFRIECRGASIIPDGAYFIVDQNSRRTTGNTIDDVVALLRRESDVLPVRRESCTYCGNLVTEWVDPDWSRGRICLECESIHDPDKEPPPVPTLDLDQLAKYFDRLPERERKVLAIVAGLDGEPPKRKDAAKALGMSTIQFGGHRDRALRLLCRAMDAEDLAFSDLCEALVVANMKGLIGAGKTETRAIHGEIG